MADLRKRAETFSRRPDVLLTHAGDMTTLDLVRCEERLIAAASAGEMNAWPSSPRTISIESWST